MGRKVPLVNDTNGSLSDNHWDKRIMIITWIVELFLSIYLLSWYSGLFEHIAGLEAPRNSLELQVEPQSYCDVGDLPVTFHHMPSCCMSCGLGGLILWMLRSQSHENVVFPVVCNMILVIHDTLWVLGMNFSEFHSRTILGFLYASFLKFVKLICYLI